ncbi:MAG: hypothetical protein JXA20_14150 [Spirochaetes bacterium]|nr:hypothetical protein [Spirochaetota bacterium]
MAKHILSWICLILFLAALQCGPSRQQGETAAQKAVSIQFRLIDESVKRGEPLMVLKGTEDRYRVAERVLLDERDIESVSVRRPPRDRYRISITLGPGGREKLSRTTARAIGRKLGIVIDNELISVPIIREPITGTGLLITGAITDEEAERIRKAFSRPR